MLCIVHILFVIFNLTRSYKKNNKKNAITTEHKRNFSNTSHEKVLNKLQFSILNTYHEGRKLVEECLFVNKYHTQFE